MRSKCNRRAEFVVRCVRRCVGIRGNWWNKCQLRNCLRTGISRLIVNHRVWSTIGRSKNVWFSNKEQKFSFYSTFYIYTYKLLFSNICFSCISHVSLIVSRKARVGFERIGNSFFSSNKFCSIVSVYPKFETSRNRLFVFCFKSNWIIMIRGQIMVGDSILLELFQHIHYYYYCYYYYIRILS